MPHHCLRPRVSHVSQRMPSIHEMNERQSSPNGSSVSSNRSQSKSPEADAGSEVNGHQSPGFSSCYTRVHLMDASNAPIACEFECTMSRGFFKVKEDWICYRRNYISVSAYLLEPVPSAVFIRGPVRLEVRHFAFLISAVTAADPPRPIDLIQHTPKRDKGPQRSPEFVPVTSPGFRAVWERLQYKTATANNGKKRGQQFFSIKVTLLGWAESADGVHKSWIELSDKFSEPMIVRGRSPGHYNDLGSFKDSTVAEASTYPQWRDSPNVPYTHSTRARIPALQTHMPEDIARDYRTGLIWQSPSVGSAYPVSQWTKNPDPGYSLQPAETSFPRSPEILTPGRNVMIDRATLPHSPREDRETFQLPPLRYSDTCHPSKRLPTFDQLILARRNTSDTSLDARAEVNGPELEAALSLASISCATQNEPVVLNTVSEIAVPTTRERRKRTAPESTSLPSRKLRNRR